MFQIATIQGRFCPQMTCDICHKKIIDNNGHVAWGFNFNICEHEMIWFVHKGQCDQIAKAHHKANGLQSLWMPLRDFTRYIIANSMVDLQSDLPAWTSIVAALLSIYGEKPKIDLYKTIGDVPQTSGIYFLWNWGQNQLDYIGQSVSVRRRLYSHQVYDKSTHTIGLSMVRNDCLQEVIEIALIGLLNPAYNIKWRTDLSQGRIL